MAERQAQLVLELPVAGLNDQQAPRAREERQQVPHRERPQRLRPEEAGADALRAQGTHRAFRHPLVLFVIAIYNPASKSRTEQLVRAKSLLLEHRAADTPVVIGRDVGGAQESIRVVPLGELDPTTVDMRCLLIVGSSQTRATVRGDGAPVVYPPRHYPEPPEPAR